MNSNDPQNIYDKNTDLIVKDGASFGLGQIIGEIKNEIKHINKSIDDEKTSFNSKVKNAIREYNFEQSKEHKVNVHFWITIAVQIAIAIATIYGSYWFTTHANKSDTHMPQQQELPAANK